MKTLYCIPFIAFILLSTSSFSQKTNYKTKAPLMFVTDTSNAMAALVTIPRGSKVKLSNFNGHYFKVKFKTDSGFVSRNEFLSTDKEIATLMLPKQLK